MNRRSFIKTITGFVGGVVAAFAPKATAAVPLVGWRAHIIILRRSGTEFICKALCDCVEQKVTEPEGRTLVSCPHYPPYYVNEDGSCSFTDAHLDWIKDVFVTPSGSPAGFKLYEWKMMREKLREPVFQD